MPSALTYPGVYVEEIPSGVRTVVGVATSITAFVGRASRGPLNEPATIFGFADFERQFGGLAADSTMSYAVRDFYLNGGSQAVIVRVGHVRAANPPVQKFPEAAEISLSTGAPAPDKKLVLVAASPGAWGNNLKVVVTHPLPDDDPKAFNLTVVETDPADPQTVVASESFLGVSIDPASPRFVPHVLAETSLLVRVQKVNDKWKVPEAARPSVKEKKATEGSGADGDPLNDDDLKGKQAAGTGIYALDKTDLFNLLCIPPPVRDGSTGKSVYQEAMPYCVRRRALLLVDPPADWTTATADEARTRLGTLGLTGRAARNAALYFPRLLVADPLRDNQTVSVVPCGAVAGVMARTDTERGVWKAPAGLDAAVGAVRGLTVEMTDDQNGQLNPLGVNCLRTFPLFGRVVWGARTLRGADQAADEYKYVPVRRLALYIEETLFRNTKWVVFEPNDEPLWSQIRLNVGAFLHDLFVQGAFQGNTPAKAYFVRCDSQTTPQNDIDRGIVNILVGFAPLKPAEFVVVKLQQIAGQIQT
ncbi:phage tail sheath subtilisin-like domain-containing protein [Streptomyces sp. NBC_00237]|uniref:phage tail sheath family protein n=1 Tax=Streptomyces sp. NBC_00237 TaxID=2975687 RepID=UPI002250FF9C|nr:phage tail sheath C-terminal domain-containing protein [Streptomyces sp. NBC_00237]MCX5205380.1 phage tail sheath subtilisin-like domain-containing protein [Streptomyces sp. NBC_00237]